MSAVVAPPVTVTSWKIGPELVYLVVAAVAYEWARQRAGRAAPTRSARAWWWAGLGVLLVALVSPLDALAEELFAAHMTQHLLLALVAPLCFALASPGRTLRWALPRDLRNQLIRRAHRVRFGARVQSVGVGLAAVAAHVLTLAVWHVPALYDAAVADVWLHAFEHVMLLATGLVFWVVVTDRRRSPRSGLPVLFLFLAALPMGGLAALLTLAPHVLYTSHLTTTSAWGLSPLGDQQVAGAIMWVPGGVVYLAMASVLLVRWLSAGPVRGERSFVWEG